MAKRALFTQAAEMPSEEDQQRIFNLKVLGCGLVALAIAIGIGFGAATGDDTFDWSAAAEAGTAIGTSFLAFATLVLARQTRRDVQFAEDSLDAAYESIRASDRPLVVATPPKPDLAVGTLFPTRDQIELQLKREDAVPHEVSEICFVLRLWNRGNGTALVTGIQLGFEGKPLLKPLGAKFVIASTAGADAADVGYRFKEPTDFAELEACVGNATKKDYLDLVVEYTDIAGHRYATDSRITVQALVGDRVTCACQWFEPREVGKPVAKT